MGGSFVMLCVRCRTTEAGPDSVRCELCDAAERLDGRTHLGGRRRVPVPGSAVLRSPVALGWAVAGLFALVGLADLAGAVLDLRTAGFVDRVAGGDWAAQDDWADSESVTGWVTRFWALAYPGSIVVFLVWFRRTRVNAEVFDPYGHTMLRGWAIGGWFVPVVSLWFPRRIASETWYASVSPADRRGPLLLNLWWGTFLLDNAVSQTASRALGRAEEVDEIARAYRYVAYSELFSVVHAVIAVLFVLALTRRQDARAHQPWPPAAPGPLPEVPDAPAPEKV
ncbi:DUF4328 domain-containing protein [Streptomyces albidoflavus]|uniref:DUF4328 domain-containing protein n=1 Tax=Streptomyces albidoflavus TaxID=1886 RepID=UPI00101E2A88|nr:hypothetical protein C0Q63_20525 [Streptomyces albidoflavus]